MQSKPIASSSLRSPIFISDSEKLQSYMRTLNTKLLQEIMHVSEPLALQVKNQITKWSSATSKQSIAIDSFRGDIFSGLQASTMTEEERSYADKHLVFLSGLYGIIRPLDGIMPYRLEMGYKLIGYSVPSLYDYWGSRISDLLENEVILNLSSIEYSKLLTKYIKPELIYSPRFLTRDEKTGATKNIAVHSKIARGTFARWAIANKIQKPSQLKNFKELGYVYDKTLSTEYEPTFICNEFKGLGLSVRNT